MYHFFSLRSAAIVLATLTVLGMVAGASAEERPHQSYAIAQFVSASEFEGAGIATHLGVFTESGSAQLSPTEIPGIFQIDGSVTYTAANGDELKASFTGHLNGLTGVITAKVTYAGGTGRFTDASGSASLAAQILGDGSIAVVVEGTIDY